MTNPFSILNSLAPTGGAEGAQVQAGLMNSVKPAGGSDPQAGEFMALFEAVLGGLSGPENAAGPGSGEAGSVYFQAGVFPVTRQQISDAGTELLARAGDRGVFPEPLTFDASLFGSALKEGSLPGSGSIEVQQSDMAPAATPGPVLPDEGGLLPESSLNGADTEREGPTFPDLLAALSGLSDVTDDGAVNEPAAPGNIAVEDPSGQSDFSEFLTAFAALPAVKTPKPAETPGPFAAQPVSDGVTGVPAERPGLKNETPLKMAAPDGADALPKTGTVPAAPAAAGADAPLRAVTDAATGSAPVKNVAEAPGRPAHSLTPQTMPLADAGEAGSAELEEAIPAEKTARPFGGTAFSADGRETDDVADPVEPLSGKSAPSLISAMLSDRKGAAPAEAGPDDTAGLDELPQTPGLSRTGSEADPAGDISAPDDLPALAAAKPNNTTANQTAAVFQQPPSRITGLKPEAAGKPDLNSADPDGENAGLIDPDAAGEEGADTDPGEIELAAAVKSKTSASGQHAANSGTTTISRPDSGPALLQTAALAASQIPAELAEDDPMDMGIDGGETADMLMEQSRGTSQKGDATAPSRMFAASPNAAIAASIARNVQNGNTRFQIRLDPPELGRVDVRLNFDQDGNVTAKLIVERVETLDLMMRDSRALERALQEAGVKLSGSDALSFSLSTSDRDAGSSFANLFGGGDGGSGEGDGSEGAGETADGDDGTGDDDYVPAGLLNVVV